MKMTKNRGILNVMVRATRDMAVGLEITGDAPPQDMTGCRKLGDVHDFVDGVCRDCGAPPTPLPYDGLIADLNDAIEAVSRLKGHEHDWGPRKEVCLICGYDARGMK
jgi:hypothetical protein|tara:strand:+ start:3641 stop:3961 length:321 start_codon:yes stop_codon:yes gene_type:complete